MSRLRAASAALILFCSLAPAAAHAAAPSWSAAGATAFEHMDAAAVPLAGGDRVLLIGGLHWTGSAHDAQTLERYDRATNTWTTLGRLPEPRRSSAAVALRDGRVLVSGGWNYPEGRVASADLYAPATDRWTDAKPMTAARGSHALVELSDGKVLAVGGADFGLSEVYDATADTWTPSTGGVARQMAGVAKLRDGRVLAAGGYGIWEDFASADLYDPATGKWTAIAPMHHARRMPSAATLPDGRVLVAGGYELNTDTAAPTTFEIYDPATNTWTVPARLNKPRANGAAMVTLSDGRLVITGGYSNPDTPNGGERRSAEIYDPATGAWTETPDARFSRTQHVAVALADDSVLVAGGTFDAKQPERLVFPTPVALPMPMPEATPAATPAATPVPPKLDPLPLAPKLVLSVPARVTAKRGVLALKVRCTGPGVCHDRLTLRVRGGRTLARANVELAAGKAKTVRLTLSRKERRRLAGKTTKVTITLGTTNRQATMKLR